MGRVRLITSTIVRVPRFVDHLERTIAGTDNSLNNGSHYNLVAACTTRAQNTGSDLRGYAQLSIL